MLNMCCMRLCLRNYNELFKIQIQTRVPPVRQLFYHQIPSRPSQKFDNFLILDFEATCDKNVKMLPQEIIEFPCMLINGKSLELVSKFHSYVRPRVNSTLTPFCTDLTGILQDMVDDEQTFEKVLPAFILWLEENCLMDLGKTIFVTSGDWDLQVMLPDQCQLSNVNVPDIMTSWINIKKSFSKATGHFPRNIHDMLNRLNIHHVGRLHSGIDDCRNICSILQALGKKGFIFEKTSKI